MYLRVCILLAYTYISYNGNSKNEFIYQSVKEGTPELAIFPTLDKTAMFALFVHLSCIILLYHTSPDT